jgi:hypothetical protein
MPTVLCNEIDRIEKEDRYTYRGIIIKRVFHYYKGRKTADVSYEVDGQSIIKLKDARAHIDRLKMEAEYE